jgi:hypothetical protein
VSKYAAYWKTIVAVIGVAVGAVVAAVSTGTAQTWGQIVASVLTAIAVYLKANT